MGEIADMILDGILDEQTGEYLGEAVGYPRSIHKYEKPKKIKRRATIPNRVVVTNIVLGLNQDKYPTDDQVYAALLICRGFLDHSFGECPERSDKSVWKKCKDNRNKLKDWIALNVEGKSDLNICYQQFCNIKMKNHAYK